MKVMILAGGFATRLWPLTENRAKPLLLLGGQTILVRILDQVLKNKKKLENSEIIEQEDVIILTNKKFEQEFKEELNKNGYGNVKIYIEDAESDGEKKGALGAVLDCINFYGVKESIAILAGDNVIPGFSIDQLICSKNESKILVKDIEDLYQAQKFGVVEIEEELREKKEEMKNERGRGAEGQKSEELLVKSFEEKPDKPKSTLVSTGFVGMGVGCFGVLEAFVRKSPDNLGGVFSAILDHKVGPGESDLELFAEKVKGDWFDVGSFETYLEAHRALNSASEGKAKNLNNSKPSNNDLKTDDPVLNSSNILSGAVFIGEDCVVEDCTLIDCIIYPGTRLIDCRLANCVIDSNCELEGVDLCGKLLRRGTKVGND